MVRTASVDQPGGNGSNTRQPKQSRAVPEPGNRHRTESSLPRLLRRRKCEAEGSHFGCIIADGRRAGESVPVHQPIVESAPRGATSHRSYSQEHGDTFKLLPLPGGRK